MLDNLVEGGSLKRCSTSGKESASVSGKARIVTKSREKCSFILNCMKFNALDPSPPSKFVLLQIDDLCNGMLMRGSEAILGGPRCEQRLLEYQHG